MLLLDTFGINGSSGYSGVETREAARTASKHCRKVGSNRRYSERSNQWSSWKAAADWCIAIISSISAKTFWKNVGTDRSHHAGIGETEDVERA